MTLSEKSAYLKGLMEGMKLDTETNEGKLISEIISMLQDVAENVSDLEEVVDCISDELDCIEEDLDNIDDYLMDDDDDEYDDEYDEDDDHRRGNARRRRYHLPELRRRARVRHGRRGAGRQVNPTAKRRPNGRRFFSCFYAKNRCIAGMQRLSTENISQKWGGRIDIADKS